MIHSHCIRIVLVSVAAIVFGDYAFAESFLPSSIVVVKDSQTDLSQSETARQLLKSNATELRIYDIDAVDRFESEINQLLPGDEAKTRQVFDQYISRIGRKTFEKDAIHAYQGIMTAVRYELEKYPAIIFDGSSVIYGVTDLDEALLLYQNWKAAKEGRQ
jgi:integrating conjugative element protein (TIGR03757 family)